MSQEEIKQECEKMYLQISQSEERIKEVRAICKHPNTFYGNYSYRIGALQSGNICSDCGEIINKVWVDYNETIK